MKNPGLRGLALPPITRDRAAVRRRATGLSSANEAPCSRLSTVPFATGPTRQVARLLGAKKLISGCRDIDGPDLGAASMESCRFAARRSPRGRFWSVVDVRKRLHRVRGRFDQSIHTSTGAWQCADLCHDPPKFSIQSALESPKHCRMRRKRLTDPRPIPEGVREPIYIRKKYVIWAR